MASDKTVTVRVRPGWLVAHDDGIQHGEGDELEVPAEVADHWQRRGWVEKVQPKSRKGKSSG